MSSTTATATTASQSLSDRLAAAKAGVSENPVKSAMYVLLVLFVIGLLVGGYFLIRHFMNKDANGATVAPLVGVAAATAATAAAAAATSAASVNGASAATPDAASKVSPGPSASVAGISATPAPVQEAEKPVTLASLANETVPWWQREFAKLPAMQVCEHGQYNPAPFPYDNRNVLYEAQAFNRLNEKDSGSDGMYTAAAMTRGDTASEIYARSKSNGIALLNRGAIRDPEKMLPRADPNTEYMRLFQVGASIADIQKNLPKTKDLMKLARDRPAGLPFQIPTEKPPLYTDGINCERRARIPTRASDKNQLFCINPNDPRELYDYRPHPLLDSVVANGGRNPNGGGFSQDAPVTSRVDNSSAAQSSQNAASNASM